MFRIISSISIEIYWNRSIYKIEVCDSSVRIQLSEWFGKFGLVRHEFQSETFAINCPVVHHCNGGAAAAAAADSHCQWNPLELLLNIIRTDPNSTQYRVDSSLHWWRNKLYCKRTFVIWNTASTVKCMYAFLRKTKKCYVSYVFFCSAQEGIHALHCTTYSCDCARILFKEFRIFCTIPNVE